jgi:hypothetical protein
MMIAAAVAQAFLQNVLSTGMAFSASRCDAEIASKFCHGRHAVMDRLADFTL